VNSTIADGAGTGTIADNDPAPSFSINDASRTEGSAVSGFVIGLSAPSGKSVTVTYTTLDGTANAPGDYTAKTANVTFTPGQTSKSISITTVQDTVDEDDETFTVRLSNAQNATIADANGLGTILDNDPPVSASIDDVTRPEGTALKFTVTLAATSGRQVQVDYATADGTATAPSDYAAASGTLTFQPGQTAKTVTINSVDDGAVEPNETLAVNLSNPVNVTLADGSGSGTIRNND
jgi:hypothetical protein